jgi:Tol biopolymer transport system component/DNA-binding winged helix-turn-helix (wHTH) protein
MPIRDILRRRIPREASSMVAVKLSGADFCVGDWLVRPSLGRIECGAETVRVTPRAMAVLVYLAEAAGRVVSRNELLDVLWPRMLVTQDALSQCIVELRKAFRDDSRRAAVIETIPKVGIRLMAPAAALEPQPSPELLEANVADGALHRAKFWLTEQPHLPPPEPLARAEFRRLTDFVGAEEQAAISRDGRWVAFISDRDGPSDVFVGQIGTGDFENLTRGAIADLRNPAVRVLNFSPPGSELWILTKTSDASGSVVDYQWTVPVSGGSLRRDCSRISEIDWSPDGRRIVYHPSAPGDPLFVATADELGSNSQIYIAPPGIHCHFPLWSRDGETLYFVRGFVPDEMDIWRIQADGRAPEQLTWHNSRVSFPALLDSRTLLYLATSADGSGPWLHALDLERGTSRRLKTGGNPYTSIAASANGRRLVATETYPTATLWRVRLDDGMAGAADAVQIPIRTTRGVSPRIGPGFLIYRAPKAGTDALWRLEVDAQARELWSGIEGRCVAGPALTADSRRVAFTVQRRGLTRLYVMNADGSDAHKLADELEVRGAPSWSPDGKSIAVGALRDGKPRLFKIPAAGDGQPILLSEGYATDPVWSPSGRFVVYTGADVGTVFEVKAVSADGAPYGVPRLFLNRGSRRLRFLGADEHTLVFLNGALSHKDFWAIDLRDGEEHPLTQLGSGPIIDDFDVASDGRTIVFDRVREESHIVHIAIGE